MKCVVFDNMIPNEFEEHISFEGNTPYRINIKDFNKEDIVPLHYAETFELLLCHDLSGEMVVDTCHYPLGGTQLFIIPPYTVHSNSITCCAGTMMVLKINFTAMDKYINVRNIFSEYGCRIEQLSYLLTDCQDVCEVFDSLVAFDGNVINCFSQILRLIGILLCCIDKERAYGDGALNSQGTQLQEIIEWTQTHYAEKVALTAVAEQLGYSKYHFCTVFKRLTGMTYYQYLTSVRIAHACRLLRSGLPAKDVCYSCGFSDASHFAQVFRSIHHCTPIQYSRKYRL